MEGRATIRLKGTQEVEAYILHPDSGDIVYAPDLGNFGAKTFAEPDTDQHPSSWVPYCGFSPAYLPPSSTSSISDTYGRFVNWKFLMLQAIAHQKSMACRNRGSRKVSRRLSQLRLSIRNPTVVSRLAWRMDKSVNGCLLIKASKSGTKNPTLYTGEGFVVRENGSIRVTPYVVVRDMWWLDENRTSLYKRFGISSDRLDQLHQSPTNI